MKDTPECGIWAGDHWIFPTDTARTDELDGEVLESLVEQSDPKRCDTAELEAAILDALDQGDDDDA